MIHLSLSLCLCFCLSFITSFWLESRVWGWNRSTGQKMLRKLQRMAACRIIEWEIKLIKGEQCGCCFSAFFREACMWDKPHTHPHWLNERVFLQLWEEKNSLQLFLMYEHIHIVTYLLIFVPDPDLQSRDMKIHQHLLHYYYSTSSAINYLAVALFPSWPSILTNFLTYIFTKAMY